MEKTLKITFQKKERENKSENFVLLAVQDKMDLLNERENYFADEILMFLKLVFQVKNKGTTLKLLEIVLEEKRREIIKEWINLGRIKDINSKPLSEQELRGKIVEEISKFKVGVTSGNTLLKLIRFKKILKTSFEAFIDKFLISYYNIII